MASGFHVLLINVFLTSTFIKILILVYFQYLIMFENLVHGSETDFGEQYHIVFFFQMFKQLFQFLFTNSPIQKANVSLYQNITFLFVFSVPPRHLSFTDNVLFYLIDLHHLLHILNVVLPSMTLIKILLFLSFLICLFFQINFRSNC